MAALRAKNLVTEIRLGDLRFSRPETAEMLGATTGLAVGDRATANLERQLEGWAAGLHLVSLAVRNTDDPDAFLDSLRGGLPHTQEYLLQEVLNAQSSEVRDCLLKCSIFDRFCPQVFDAVCAADSTPEAAGLNGQDFVGLLQKGNLFVIPLDDKRQWYRYHHLFADVVETHLLAEQPNQVPILHQRASSWYEANGLRAEAIHHALAGQDFEGAAGLIELAWPAILKGIQPATWLGWVKALPDELVRTRPVLSAGYAWTLLDSGQLEAAETRLNDALRALREDPGTEIDVVTIGIATGEFCFQSRPDLCGNLIA